MVDGIILGIGFFAALIAGAINAIAGGGTLVSFPILIGLGFTPVTANIINTIGICPGYCSGILAQREEFASQKRRILIFIPIAVLGSLMGSLLLIKTGESSFRVLVPYLILGASFLLFIQKPVKTYILTRTGNIQNSILHKSGIGFLIFLGAIYGGYFGAGVSVIIIALLGLIYDDSLTSLNVLKQAISFSINLSAAIFFLFFVHVNWLLVVGMGCGSLIGGYAGGRIVGRISPDFLRNIVVIIGLVIALISFLWNS